MVVWNKSLTDVLLLSPEEKLLLEVARWGRVHRRFPIRVVSSTQQEHVLPAARQAVFVCIDASADAEGAMAVMEHLRDEMGSVRVAVYTDRSMPDLEIQVRSAGAAFLLGPMKPEEWEAVLEDVSQTHRVGA
jgi:DNA-binding NarL/FixJ family response regulator